MLNGTEVKVLITVIGRVDGGLLGTDVVRPDGFARALCAFSDEATTGEEVEEGWQVGIQNFNR